MVEVNCWIGAGTKPRLLIFRLVRKIVNSDSTVTFVMSVRPSAPPRGTARLPPVRFSWHLTLKIFWKSVKKFQYSLISDKNNGTVHEDRCTFVIISHWIFLRMRNASEKFGRQNGNTILCWVFFFFFRKLRRLWDNVGKILYSQTDHIWQCNKAHAHCVLYS